MSKGNMLLLLSVLLFHSAIAQGIQKDSSTAPLEKVYQHWDKEVYVPGETGWFKAYIVSDHSFSPYSTVLFTDLMDADNRMVKRIVSPVLNGVTQGQLFFSDSIRLGIYTIRAYTPLMLNHGYLYLFEKSIQIGLTKKGSDAQRNTNDTPNLFFYPEGGTFMTGRFNTIAFHALQASGAPAFIKGSIVDDKGQYQAEVETFVDGRGSFELFAEEGRSYALEAEFENKQFRFPLPVHSAKGVFFKVRPHVKGLIFELIDSLKPAGNQLKRIVGRIDDRIVFNMEVPEDKKNFKGIIDTQSENLGSGVLSLSVLDELGGSVAERLVFIKKNDARAGGGSISDPLSIQNNVAGSFSIKLDEPFSGHLSIAVTEAKEQTKAPPSIFSYLLLQTELPGTIENPDWYFQTTPDSAARGLDLLMLTNGFERYKKWTDEENKPGSQFKDPGFISIQGRVKGWELNDTTKRLMLLVTSPGAANQLQFLTPNGQGQFSMDSSIWFDHVRLGFLETFGKKSRARDVELDRYSIDSLVSLSFFRLWRPSRFSASGLDQNEKENLFSSLPQDSIKTLKEVVVAAARKLTSEQLNTEYTHGFFSMDATRTLDLVNGMDVLVQENIFEYLKLRVPGLAIVEPNYENPTMPSLGDDPLNDPSGYRIYFRQQASASSLGNIPMAVYLNEVQTSPTVIAAIPANQIALVKVFSTFPAAPGGGSALAIYTRKPDPTQRNTDDKTIVYSGFTPLKNFTPSTLFFLEKNDDLSRTAFWMPDVVAEKLKQTFSIPSLGIDRSKPIRIRIQGMDVNGKFISIDKVLMPKQ